MASIERSALVMHNAEQMFDLVKDIKSYPDFLPWCHETHINDEGDDFLEAGMTIKKGGIEQTFTTRNQFVRPEYMTLSLVDGPFKRLDGRFTFTPLSEHACKVVLNLDFEVSGKILSMTLSPIVKQAANTMVDVFIKRADKVYGKSK